jgi:hypothetical protein
MMQRWGRRHVSSALEVYLVLSSPPSDPHALSDWKDLLSIEPPIWGGAVARKSALTLAARGHRVWSWDDCGVVFSDSDVLPPHTVRYRPWRRALPPSGLSPITPPVSTRPARDALGQPNSPVSPLA